MEFDMTNKNAEADLIVPKDTEEKDSRTVLDELRKELKRVVKNPPVVLQVPSRPSMSIKYDTNIEAKMLQSWRKACRDKSMPDNFDSLKFSTIVMANQAEEITFSGEVIVDEGGELLTFRNQAFVDMLGAIGSIDAVRRLYGVDGHIFIAADEILRAAGYDSEGQEQQTDPTLIS
jgi:hypothetical protein